MYKRILRRNYKVIELLEMGRKMLEESEICMEEAITSEKLEAALSDQRLTLSIIGQFKRGKSSLINKMLGKKFLPVGIIPITSVVTKIIKGEEKVFVYFEDGAIRETTVEGLEEYINEQQNPNNIKEVSQVTVQTQGEILNRGINLVDTPGVGSIHKHNTKVAYDFIRESDGAIFMLSVDSPVNEIEIDFLKEAKAYPGSFYFVVNKADMVDKEDLDIYIEYCRSLLSGIMDMEKEDVKLFPVSAKTGEGISELEDFILEDLEARRAEIMELSAAKRMIDIINRGLMRMSMYWTATRMSGGNFDFRFNKLAEAIEGEKCEYFKSLNSAKEEELSVSQLTTGLNKLKKALTVQVKENFDIDYYYQVEGVVVSDKDKTASSKEIDVFRKRGEEMCKDLDKTLNTLLLYREDDSIVVAKRIRTLKRIQFQLKGIREALSRTI